MNFGFIPNKKKVYRRGCVMLVASLSLLLVLCFAFAGCDQTPPVMELDDLYSDAVALMEEEKYEEAIVAFEALDGYKDSDKNIADCRSAITERDYKKALTLMDSGEYGEALAILTALGDYKDCSERAEECRVYSNYAFELNGTKDSYAIVRYKGNDAKLVIPAEYKGLPITVIGDDAFIRCSTLAEVVIPQSVVSVGRGAFAYCHSLESIKLPDGIESIFCRAFYSCESLASLTLPRGIKDIGDEALSGCLALKSIIFVGSEEEWSRVSLGDEWNLCNDPSGDTLSIPVEFAPVCNGVDHYVAIDVAVSPTCTEAGLSEGSHCSVCNVVIVEQTYLEALGHDTVMHDAKSPACLEIGWEKYETCSRCDYSTYKEIAASGHDLKEIATKAASCTEDGWNSYVECSRCDYSTFEMISALGHDTVEHSAREASCTEIGWTVYETCSRCEHTTYKEIPALEHKLTLYSAKEPTCTDVGWNEYEECLVCDYTTYVEVPALNHDPIFYAAKAASCTESGWNAYEKCSRCDYTTFEEIAALSHDIKQYAAQEPSCDKVGWDAYEACSRCGYTTYKEIGMLDHKVDQYEAKEPTCTESGWNAYEKCSKCSYTTFVGIGKLGHDTVLHEAQKVTCISDGWDAYETCTRCDYSTFIRISANDDAHDVNKENTCVICLEYFDSGVVFTLSGDGSHYVVTDYTGNAERVVIPSEYKGIEVTAIGDSAFADRESVKTLVITGNIVSIGENAFSGSAIEQIKYTGSESEWSDIEKSQETLMGIEIIFDYDFKDGEVRFHFINVGQGDSILVTTPWGNMLIDSGDLGSTSRNAIVNYLAEYEVSSFEYVIFTHPDADHIGSADYILLNYDVENVIMPDCNASTQVYKRLLDAIDTTGVNLILIGENAEYCEQPGFVFEIGALVNTVLAPIEKDSNSNDMSVVIKSEFGEISVLFTGDAEKDEEGDMLAAYRNGELDCDILKVGHHGSNTSTTAAFLEAVSPEIAIISCGLDNKFGHPHSEIVSRLESAGVEYYRTDLVGDVVIWTDGSKIEVAA